MLERWVPESANGCIFAHDPDLIWVLMHTLDISVRRRYNFSSSKSSLTFKLANTVVTLQMRVAEILVMFRSPRASQSLKLICSLANMFSSERSPRPYNR